MPELGEYRDKSFEERHKIYVDHACDLPCDDTRAAGFDRVVWLKEEAHFTGNPGTILDVGCHDGFVTRWAAHLPGTRRIVGLEPGEDPFWNAEKAIERPEYADVREKFEYINAGYQEAILDIHKDEIDVQYEAETFDWIVAFELIEHFLEEEVVEIFDFMREHSKPGSKLFFCTPNEEGPWGSCNPDPHHLLLFTKESLDMMLHEHFPGDARTWTRYYSKCPHLMVKVERKA